MDNQDSADGQVLADIVELKVMMEIKVRQVLADTVDGLDRVYLDGLGSAEYQVTADYKESADIVEVKEYQDIVELLASVEVKVYLAILGQAGSQATVAFLDTQDGQEAMEDLEGAATQDILDRAATQVIQEVE